LSDIPDIKIYQYAIEIVRKNGDVVDTKKLPVKAVREIFAKKDVVANLGSAPETFIFDGMFLLDYDLL
jgi:hypothetical protein